MSTLKTGFLFLSLFAILTCHSQKTIGELKAFCDGLIKNNISKSVMSKIKSNGYFGQDADHSKKEFLAGDCFEDRNKTVKFELMSFMYELYSKQLDYEYNFRISIDSSLRVYASTNGGFNNIPPCIRKNQSCNFITKEAAIIIAKKDSISYSDNLIVEMLIIIASNTKMVGRFIPKRKVIQDM
jgi:hypothetical protein